MNGACSDHVFLWESQKCNPVAACFLLLQDHVMFIFILPIIAQSLLNGVTYRCSVISWCISTFTVIGCLFHVQGWLDSWIMLTPFGTLAILYRHEKLARVTCGYKIRTALLEKHKRKHTLLQQCAERDLLSTNLESLKSDELFCKCEHYRKCMTLHTFLDFFFCHLTYARDNVTQHVFTHSPQ